MRTVCVVLVLVSSALLLGCPQQQPAGSVPSPATAGPAADVTFDRKATCFEASGAFTYDAISPREHPYTLQRSCYSPRLNTCVVEYVALDGSATIFDVLNREPLAVYLNYPGLADQIRVNDRLASLDPVEAAPTDEQEMTPERREYLSVAARVFGTCAR